MKRKDDFYRSKLQHLVEHDLYGNLLTYRSAGRSKRFAALVVPAIAGLVTLAVESLSGYLQNKRHKAMAKAMDALQQNQKLTFNQLHRYKDDLLLYGTYNLKSTDSVLDTLQGLYHRQSSLEKHIIHLQEYNWPQVYLKSQTGLISYVAELNFFLHSISNKFNFLYSTMIDEIKALVKDIATLSRGRLPPELFSPSFLHNVTIKVMSELLKSNTGYKIAFPQVDAYYDMKVATFSLDKENNLIVTFPILIEPIQNKPLSLYEIETVPVPIVDMDKSADGFSEVHVNKPYIAASPLSYIQLREPELQRCKVVQQQYYCEEAFMVKHVHHDTCESSLFYNRSSEKIAQVCKFTYTHDQIPVPSVLDGGSHLVLANFQVEHSPSCDPRVLTNISGRDYTLTQRDVLCNCSLQSNLAYLPRDLGSCNSNFTRITFTHKPNAAFLELFHDYMATHPLPPSLPSVPSQGSQNNSFDFPLHLPENVSSSITSLRALHEQMLRNLSSSSTNSRDRPSIDILMSQYNSKISQNLSMLRAEILAKHEDSFLSSPHAEAASIISLVLSLLTCMYLVHFVIDYRKTKTLLRIDHDKAKKLLATATLMETMSKTQAYPVAKTTPLFTTHPPMLAENKVLCYDPVVSGIFTLISILGLAFVIMHHCRKGNLCRGYLYSNTFVIKLVLCGKMYYIPLKLRTMAGQLHKIKAVNMLQPCQVKLLKHVLWDVIMIDWQQVKITYNGEKINMPSTIIVPLKDKIRTRWIFRGKLEINLAVCQGRNWYDLHSVANMVVPPPIGPRYPDLAHTSPNQPGVSFSDVHLSDYPNSN